MGGGYINTLRGNKCFSRNELFEAIIKTGQSISEASFKLQLQRLLKQRQILRVGRNAYVVNIGKRQEYDYDYSDLANNVAEKIKEKHSFLFFTIFESIQLNEFVNHQIAHNTVYVSVSEGLGSFVFETLKAEYQGKVLVNPSIDVFHQYWVDDMIVIEDLITEAPKAKEKPWMSKPEKYLVDLMADPLLLESISVSEYPAIYEETFIRYVVDESQMFRYAKRRNAYAKVKQFIKERTNVELRTE